MWRCWYEWLFQSISLMEGEEIHACIYVKHKLYTKLLSAIDICLMLFVALWATGIGLSFTQKLISWKKIIFGRWDAHGNLQVAQGLGLKSSHFHWPIGLQENHVWILVFPDMTFLSRYWQGLSLSLIPDSLITESVYIARVVSFF